MTFFLLPKISFAEKAKAEIVVGAIIDERKSNNGKQ